MLCEDHRLYVVKFQNNPQGIRVLANDLIVTNLCEALGLSVAPADIVEVREWLIESDAEMVMELQRGKRGRYVPGQQFGSVFMGGIMPGLVVDHLPIDDLARVSNLREFAGMLAVDKWTGNCDGRQAVFHRNSRGSIYRAAFIDQGFCFNAGEWSFPDSPLRGVYARTEVYAHVKGWSSFEPWLSRIEGMDGATLSRIAEAVPPVWYGGDIMLIERLMEELLARRGRVRDLIAAFRDSDRMPFPQWSSQL